MNNDEIHAHLRRVTEQRSEQALNAGDNQGARTDPSLTSPSAATKAAVAEAIREALETTKLGPPQVQVGHVVVPLPETR